MYIVSSENITTLSGPQGTFFVHKSKARASSFTPLYPPPRLVCYSHRTLSPITSKTRCIKYVQTFYAYLHNVQRTSSINFTENRARSSKLFRHLCLSDVLKEGVINNIPTTIKRSQKYCSGWREKCRCLNGSISSVQNLLCSDIVLRM